MKRSPGASAVGNVMVADHLNIFKILRNKGRTIVAYNAKRAFRHLKTPQAFLNAVQELESEKLEGNRVMERARRLWFLERFIREARIFDNGSFLLKEPAVERFAPIFHVGWGMDLICKIGFDFPRYRDVLESSAHPKYRLLVIEPVGIAYIAARNPIKTSVIGIPSPRYPDRGSLLSFFNQFTESEIPYISHGYGRALYFQTFSLYSAVQKALHCPSYFDPLFAIKGLAFAYTMVNCSNLDQVFDTAESLIEKNRDRKDIRFFKEGVQSALSFMEWSFPGVLESLNTHPIVDGAGKMLESYQSAGGLYTF